MTPSKEEIATTISNFEVQLVNLVRDYRALREELAEVKRRNAELEAEAAPVKERPRYSFHTW